MNIEKEIQNYLDRLEALKRKAQQRIEKLETQKNKKGKLTEKENELFTGLSNFISRISVDIINTNRFKVEVKKMTVEECTIILNNLEKFVKGYEDEIKKLKMGIFKGNIAKVAGVLVLSIALVATINHFSKSNNEQQTNNLDPTPSSSMTDDVTPTPSKKITTLDLEDMDFFRPVRVEEVNEDEEFFEDNIAFLTFRHKRVLNNTRHFVLQGTSIIHSNDEALEYARQQFAGTDLAVYLDNSTITYTEYEYKSVFNDGISMSTKELSILYDDGEIQKTGYFNMTFLTDEKNEGKYMISSILKQVDSETITDNYIINLDDGNWIIPEKDEEKYIWTLETLKESMEAEFPPFIYDGNKISVNELKIHYNTYNKLGTSRTLNKN